MIGDIISFFSEHSEQLKCFFTWFFIVCIDLLIILFPVLAIRSCNHKESIQKEYQIFILLVQLKEAKKLKINKTQMT